MAKQADPNGERTLAVHVSIISSPTREENALTLPRLTKPDILDKGGEQNIIYLVNGKRNKLTLGYCIVRNRGQDELGSTTDERT